jgi:chromosome segregation ATPase
MSDNTAQSLIPYDEATGNTLAFDFSALAMALSSQGEESANSEEGLDTTTNCADKDRQRLENDKTKLEAELKRLQDKSEENEQRINQLEERNNILLTLEKISEGRAAYIERLRAQNRELSKERKELKLAKKKTMSALMTMKAKFDKLEAAHQVEVDKNQALTQEVSALKNRIAELELSRAVERFTL